MSRLSPVTVDRIITVVLWAALGFAFVAIFFDAVTS
jgi:hypothetical protein